MRRLALRPATLGLWVILAVLAAPEASGQTLPVPPDSGARIRIWRRGAHDWEQSTFVRLAGDSLIVYPRLCCGMDTVPMRAVRGLAVSTGRERRVSRILGWAAWGAVVGVGAGVIADRLTHEKGNELNGIGIIFIVPWTALGGAVAGGLLGSRKVDRWTQIYPSDGAALMVVPKPGGRVDIAFALRF
jgi:hypothetical protein